ncbi:MAG TPA: PIN domain-containing protein [Rhizomicrobium sp.]|jgi:predicted nucleic acid-binding protein|nr:PIN domain-containing protein [Rhizomicrobium sp.]
MKIAYFLDSNILIYAAAGRHDAPGKFVRATEILANGDYGISAQVLQEFYVNVTRKPSVPLRPHTALLWVERLALQPCAAADATLVKNAIVVSERYKISYWDGAILAAAESLGAEVVYSEDLNHGQVYGSVRVMNPFR